MSSFDDLKRVLDKARSYGLRMAFYLLRRRISMVLERPFPRIIWGDHIGLRPVHITLKPGEMERLYQWARDEEVLRWSGGRTTELDFGAFKKQIEQERKQFRSSQILFYIVNLSGELMGRVGLYAIDWSKLEGEYGISLEKKFWGQRFGREAARLFQRYIFTRTPIRRIYLGTFVDNYRAQRSFAAAGFRNTGVVESHPPKTDRQVEGIQMEILRSEFFNHP